MVSNLLDSIGRLESADDLELTVILVENGDGTALLRPVASFAAAHERIRIHHLVEPRLGIVFARNAALEFAINSDFDSLAFVDDDEVVAPRWLVELSAEQRRGNHDITGGPVEAFVGPSPLGYWEALVWKGLSSRSRHNQKTAEDRKTGGRESDVVISTNNCLVSLPFVRRVGLLFNEQYNLTGGEDTRFFRDATRLGARTGWAPKAVVSEEIVRERLAPSYQLRRARDHALVSFYDKFEGRPVRKWMRAPVSAAFKLLAGCGLLLLAPVTSGATFFNSLRAFGEAAGRAQGLMGIKRKPYARTTGN